LIKATIEGKIEKRKAVATVILKKKEVLKININQEVN